MSTPTFGIAWKYLLLRGRNMNEWAIFKTNNVSKLLIDDQIIDQFDRRMLILKKKKKTTKICYFIYQSI